MSDNPLSKDNNSKCRHGARGISKNTEPTVNDISEILSSVINLSAQPQTRPPRQPKISKNHHEFVCKNSEIHQMVTESNMFEISPKKANKLKKKVGICANQVQESVSRQSQESVSEQTQETTSVQTHEVVSVHSQETVTVQDQEIISVESEEIVSVQTQEIESGNIPEIVSKKTISVPITQNEVSPVEVSSTLSSFNTYYRIIAFYFF